MVIQGSRVVFQGSGSVFMIFYSSRSVFMVFQGSWFQVGFYGYSRFRGGLQGSRSVFMIFYSSRLVFMVFHNSRSFFMVPG